MGAGMARQADNADKRAAREAERIAKREAWRGERTAAERIIRNDISAKAKTRANEITKIGRPTVMTDDIASAILERVANGESIASITSDDTMPSASTIARYAAKEPSFDAALARARMMQADVLVDQCLAIADDTSNDAFMSPTGPTANTTAVTRAKLQIETRLRLAAQINPSRYAERAQPPADVTVHVNALTLDARSMPTDVRDRLKAALLAAKALPAGDVIDG
jgi:hypothetical protein